MILIIIHVGNEVIHDDYGDQDNKTLGISSPAYLEMLRTSSHLV